jgi:hypothetical protein
MGNGYVHQNAKGNGKWGWIKFIKFRSGDDYINTGIMIVADDNITFPNVYGTPVKSEVLYRLYGVLRARKSGHPGVSPFPPRHILSTFLS